MTPQHVAILLCTYNGEKYIRQQVESIIAQTHTDWSLWVSDDGSKDNTLHIIQECMENQPQSLHIRLGPSIGFAHNFMSLLNCEAIHADYFAFSDQDDIWHCDKIERALRWHVSVSGEMPNLYGGRSHLVDEAGQSIGYSRRFSKKPCFSNALVQSMVGGNTMVMNQKARDLLRVYKDGTDVAFHDWWAYIFITGAGGNFYFDLIPSIDYRQHGANLVGLKKGVAARLRRFHKLMQGEFRELTEQHVLLLEQVNGLLTAENQTVFEYFKQVRSSGLIKRLISAKKSRIFRQTFLENMGLLVAILFRKI
ncbi:MAG: glycosyltransferase family 2 protein [Betaproteobacteria bacterium]|nr:glycosyltransferase family 2 protein [Betaproteobacteria bacterium]